MAKTVILATRKLTQGEKLYILVFRARALGLKTPDCAKGIDVTETYLAALFHRESLSMKIIQNASQFFGVPPSFFDEDVTLHELVQRVNNLERDRLHCANENKSLREDIIVLQAEIIRLRREAGIGADDKPSTN